MEEIHLQTTSRDMGYGTVINLLTTKLIEDSVITELEELVLQVIKHAKVPNIVLNFDNVIFLSSSVLRTLIKINTAVAERKGQLRLCSIESKILEVFKITKLDKVFDIRQDVDMAVASIIKLYLRAGD